MDPVLVKEGDKEEAEYAAKHGETTKDDNRVDSEEDLKFKEKMRVTKSSNETTNVRFSIAFL